MNDFSNMITMFDMIGLILSVSSVAIVGHTAVSLIGKLRQGLLALIWGLTIVGVSFLWSILSKGFGLVGLPELQSVILAFGMAFFLFSTKKLFAIYHQENPVELATSALENKI